MKIVIFDMDGTLIDSKTDMTISINYIRKKYYNLEALTADFVVDAINKDVRNLAKLFYNKQTYIERDREAFEAHYAKQCTQNSYLYDGVREVLKELKDAGVKISVATNAPTKFAKRMLESLNVDTMFDMILGADKIEDYKPSPLMINNILDFHNFDKNNGEAWMIGDNSKDMGSAENADINSIFVTWGFSKFSEYKNTIAKPNQILDIVL